MMHTHVVQEQFRVYSFGRWSSHAVKWRCSCLWVNKLDTDTARSGLRVVYVIHRERFAGWTGSEIPQLEVTETLDNLSG